MASVITGPLFLPSLLSSSSLSWRFGFISYHSLKGLSTSQVHTSPFEILRRVSKIQRHFSGKSKSSLLSGGGASGAFARRKTDCDLGCDLWWMRRPFSNAESARSNACYMQLAARRTHRHHYHPEHRRRQSASHPPTPSYMYEYVASPLLSLS